MPLKSHKRRIDTEDEVSQRQPAAPEICKDAAGVAALSEPGGPFIQNQEQTEGCSWCQQCLSVSPE